MYENAQIICEFAKGAMALDVMRCFEQTGLLAAVTSSMRVWCM